MCGYETVSTVDEKARLPTAASAETMTTPAALRAGGVTTNVAVAESPADVTAKGADAGDDVQPAGRSSRNVPVTDRSTKLVAVTTSRWPCGAPAVGTTSRSESKPTDNSGTTFRSRRNSPRTRSAYRKRTGLTSVSSVPLMLNVTLAEISCGANGIPCGASAGQS